MNDHKTEAHKNVLTAGNASFSIFNVEVILLTASMSELNLYKAVEIQNKNTELYS